MRNSKSNLKIWLSSHSSPNSSRNYSHQMVIVICWVPLTWQAPNYTWLLTCTIPKINWLKIKMVSSFWKVTIRRSAPISSIWICATNQWKIVINFRSSSFLIQITSLKYLRLSVMSIQGGNFGGISTLFANSNHYQDLSNWNYVPKQRRVRTLLPRRPIKLWWSS